MKRIFNSLVILMLCGISVACNNDKTVVKPDPEIETSGIRVPAEWEPHAATWIQWANEYESSVLLSFANFIKVVQQYEPVHLIVNSETDKTETMQFLYNNGVTASNLTWHIMPVDNSWMRDNGPIYVTDGTKTWVQNWKFNGWGGGFEGGKWGYESTPYENDNRIPAKVAEYLGLEVKDHLNYVLEKGNIEVNGKGILAISWDCQDHRNPGLTKEQHEAILKENLGVKKIIWAYGHHKEDGTIGHIDGFARFINENTIVIADFEEPNWDREDKLAKACKDEGLNVLRYYGSPNWLVGNGFVVAMGEDGYNDELKKQLQTFFPDRDIYMIDAKAIGEQGGGIHCVTNDQPLLK